MLLDRFVEGRVSRVSPEAPVPVLHYGGSRMHLGGAGNVAANILAYGAAVTLVALSGKDEDADELLGLCAGFHRLTPRFVPDPGRPTTVKTRYLAGWHQLLRVDAESTRPASPSIRAEIVAGARAALGESDIVVLSDYAKGVLDRECIAGIVAAARAAGKPVVIDPKKADAAAFAGASLITPNIEEMAQLSGIRADSDEAAVTACRALLERSEIEGVLLTRGEAGMTLVTRTEAEPLHVRAAALRVFDVTGAGDTVIATLATALAVGVPMADAVRLANAAAGIVVAKPGTATVSPQELRQALGAARVAGIAEAADAAETARRWKSERLKVGFTNGCFDLLHQGHLFSLEQAARRCDRLIVGVNGDASVKRLKGPGRPVQDAATRAAVLAALRFVDLVVVFDEDTPEALIGDLLPDVLFKGADYEGRAIAGAAAVEAAGGRVELLPLLPGHSTSATIKGMGR